MSVDPAVDAHLTRLGWTSFGDDDSDKSMLWIEGGHTERMKYLEVWVQTQHGTKAVRNAPPTALHLMVIWPYSFTTEKLELWIDEGDRRTAVLDAVHAMCPDLLHDKKFNAKLAEKVLGPVAPRLWIQDKHGPPRRIEPPKTKAKLSKSTNRNAKPVKTSR